MGTLDADSERFHHWFAGEFDNHEQVWQQKVNGLEDKALHEHIHHIFKRVAALIMGEDVYFVKQYMGGDYDNVFRQRLYQFSKNK